MLYIVFEGGEAIGRKDMMFLSSRVGGVDAFEEEVTVTMDDCVLKSSKLLNVEDMGERWCCLRLCWSF